MEAAIFFRHFKQKKTDFETKYSNTVDVLRYMYTAPQLYMQGTFPTAVDYVRYRVFLHNTFFAYTYVSVGSV